MHAPEANQAAYSVNSSCAHFRQKVVACCMAAPPELLVVMPVYNEQASVRKVVREWFEEIENWTEEFCFLAINDGSSDGTRRLLARMQEELGDRLQVIDQENMGHGQSCLKGYGFAVERQIPYVFQIDSDGQCDPQFFFRFWRDRARYDVIYGQRQSRDDGFRRLVASIVLKLVLWAVCGVYCIDANVPYRLMRTSVLLPCLGRIPSDFVLGNIALAVLLRRSPAIRHGKVPIHFRERYGGEPTVPMGRFGQKAVELVSQLQRLLRT